MLISSWL